MKLDTVGSPILYIIFYNTTHFLNWSVILYNTEQVYWAQWPFTIWHVRKSDAIRVEKKRKWQIVILTLLYFYNGRVLFAVRAANSASPLLFSIEKEREKGINLVKALSTSSHLNSQRNDSLCNKSVFHPLLILHKDEIDVRTNRRQAVQPFWLIPTTLSPTQPRERKTTKSMESRQIFQLKYVAALRAISPLLASFSL